MTSKIVMFFIVVNACLYYTKFNNKYLSHDEVSLIMGMYFWRR